MGPEQRIMWDVDVTMSDGTQTTIPVEAENADEAKKAAMEVDGVVSVGDCKARFEEK